MAFVNRTSRVANNVQRMAGGLRDAAEHGVSQFGDTASDMYRQGRLRARAMAHDLEDSFTDHPVRWLLIGVGVGCLISAAFVRR